MAKKPKESICDSYCKGCIFSNIAAGNTLMCVYYLVTNIRRPSPAGTGCTVKQVGRGKGRWAYENNQTWNTRKKKEAKLKEAKPKEVLHKVCPCCGRPFETEYSRKIYCSSRCKNKVVQKAFNQRKKAELTITCAICGNQFTSTDGRRKCCSPECTAISRKLKYRQYDIKRGRIHEKTE